MGINDFTKMVKRYCRTEDVYDVVLFKDLKDSRVSVDTGVLLSVAEFITKNEVTKKNNFPEGDLEEKYLQIFPFKLFMLITRLISEEGPEYVFVLDGSSPHLKRENEGKKRKEDFLRNQKRLQDNLETLQRRKRMGLEIDKNLKEEIRKSWITGSGKIGNSNETLEGILECMGIPCIRAPGESERYCAALAKRGLVDLVYTTDSDAIVHGAPAIATKITTSEDDEGFPSPAFEITQRMPILESLKMSNRAFVDLCIAMKCDYNSLSAKEMGRFGFVSAYKLIKKYRRLDKVPEKVKDVTPLNYVEVRKLFSDPPDLEEILNESFETDYQHFLDQGFRELENQGFKVGTIKNIYESRMLLKE